MAGFQELGLAFEHKPRSIGADGLVGGPARSVALPLGYGDATMRRAGVDWLVHDELLVVVDESHAAAWGLVGPFLGERKDLRGLSVGRGGVVGKVGAAGFAVLPGVGINEAVSRVCGGFRQDEDGSAVLVDAGVDQLGVHFAFHMVSAAFYSVGTICVLAYGFTPILWSFLGSIFAGESWRRSFEG